MAAGKEFFRPPTAPESQVAPELSVHSPPEEGDLPAAFSLLSTVGKVSTFSPEGNCY